MKRTLLTLLATAVLAGCARDGVVDEIASTSGQSVAAINPSDSKGGTSASDDIAANAVAEDTYELTYSGPWLWSRDAIEGRLLYRAALLARQHGKSWFRFLHMPGEAGALTHPSRHSPSFGAAYGHWQPHWSYQTGLGWQPWHPEWGVPFWAETREGRDVKRVEVHAMIRLRDGPFAATENAAFDAQAVVKDLRPVFR